MDDIDYQYGSFSISFTENDLTGYFSIHPEMYPEKDGIAPTGRYFVYCLHPGYGSAHFIIEQNINCSWVSESLPPFITFELMRWIGDKIERQNK